MEQECKCVRVSVVLVNRLLREAVARIVSQKPDLQVAVIGASLPQTIDQIRTSDTDVLLLDSLNLVSENYSLESFRDTLPFQLVLIGDEDDEKLFLNAIQVGVVGYVSKDASAKDLVATLRSVTRGVGVCPPRLCRFLFNYVARQARITSGISADRLRRLTRREKELVPLIGQGLTNKEIAVRLGLSEQTVKNHVHHILQKFDSTDRVAVMESLRARDTAA